MYEETKQLSPGVKVGLFFGFVVVWLALAFLGHKAVSAFRLGGWGMWPILAVGMVFVIITVERVRYLFFRASHDTKGFVAEVQKQLMHGNVTGALSYCQATTQPLGRIVAAGLSHLNRSDEEVQEAVDEAALYELPKIETRTGYLAMIGNIATLLGLLGTIVGLIKSFAGVSLQNVNDPATMAKAAQYVHLVPACQGLTNPKDIVRCIDQNKATILAQGISEAMNCTAFGLLVGICALLAFSVLNGRTQHMLDDISDSTVYLMNLAAGNRRAMKLPS
jgi:biopolymer transport protein ExbB/TolQ